MEVQVGERITIIRLERPTRWQVAVKPARGPLVYWPDPYMLYPRSPLLQRRELDQFLERAGVEEFEREQVYQKLGELEA